MSAVIDLRAERVNRGLTQAEAARKMNVDTDALARAERGVAQPHPRNALRIASFYGYKVTDLWPLDAYEPLAEPTKDAA